MSPAGLALARGVAADLDALHQLAKHDPAAADTIVAALVEHLRSSRPESVSPLGVLPPPRPVMDPMGAR